MLLFAHMGIGSRLVKPWSRRLPYMALLAGTLLPDAIDKPLYYVNLFYSRMTETNVGLINNSRTIGHTGLFLLALALLAFVRRSRLIAALALGTATHLLLDNLNDALVDTFMPELKVPGEAPQRSAMVALLWPFLQSYFPTAPFATFSAHMHRSFNPFSIGFEALGAFILYWDHWQNRHVSEIHAFFARRRQKRREREHRRKKPGA